MIGQQGSLGVSPAELLAAKNMASGKSDMNKEIALGGDLTRLMLAAMQLKKTQAELEKLKLTRGANPQTTVAQDVQQGIAQLQGQAPQQPPQPQEQEQPQEQPPQQMAQMDSGIGGLPAGAMDNEDAFAGGGIVAFSAGSTEPVKYPQENYRWDPNTRQNEPVAGVTETPGNTETATPGSPTEKRPNMQPGANASIEDYAKYLGAVRTAAGIGAPRQAEKEMLDKRMAARGGEESTQNWLKAAEFFANMANTPGGLLRSITGAGAKALPEFAKLQAAQRQTREADAKIQADITEASRLEQVGLFDQGAKLRSEAEKLQGENDRNKATIAGHMATTALQGENQLKATALQGENQLKATGLQGTNALAVAKIQAGATLGAAGMRGGAEKRDAEVFEAYVKSIAVKNPTLTPEQVKVAAYKRMQSDYRGGEAKLDAAGEEAAAKRYAELLKGKPGAGLRATRREINDMEDTPAERHTKAQVATLLRLKTREAEQLALLREAAKKVPSAADPAASSAPTGEQTSGTGVNTNNPLLRQ